MEPQNAKISVVIAALNEEEGIGPTLEELQKSLDNCCLLVVDGDSSDNTVETAKKMGVTVILQHGKGKGDALFKGIKHVGSDISYVVFIDADYTYPARYVPEMIEILEKNPNVGMVIGNRFNKTGIHDFSFNQFYIGNRLLAFAQHVVNGIKLADPLSGLRVVRREIIDDWKPKSKGFDVEAEMNYRIEQKGFEIVEIPIQYRARLGDKKLKVRHGFGILKRIISESFFA